MKLFDHLLSNRQFVTEWFRSRLTRSTPAVAAESSDRERQALTKIKDMCSIANQSAEKIGLDPHGDDTRADRLRFDSAKRMSIKLLDDVADVANRDDALVTIIDLCLKANDLSTAMKLMKVIHTEAIRDRLLKEYPVEFY